MANRCAGLDPTWAHLPTPAPTHAAASHYYCSSSPAWLTSAAAFENEALTSALRASMAPASHAYYSDAAAAAAAASSFSCPATPSSSTTTSSASELLSASSGGHDYAPAAPAACRSSSARALAGTRAGRVAKQRKPRPSRSRRPRTTYITADPANFCRMVQEITGLPVIPGPSSFLAASETAATVAAPNWTTPAPACELPTLDTSAFLLDRTGAAALPAPEDKKSPAGGGHASSLAVTDADAAMAADAAGPAGNDHSSSALLELEALVCAAADGCGFPTLDSWGMMMMIN